MKQLLLVELSALDLWFTIASYMEIVNMDLNDPQNLYFFRFGFCPYFSIISLIKLVNKNRKCVFISIIVGKENCVMRMRHRHSHKMPAVRIECCVSSTVSGLTKTVNGFVWMDGGFRDEIHFFWIFISSLENYEL